MGCVGGGRNVIYIQQNGNSLKEIDTRGETMNNWELIQLKDSEEYSAFYSEDFGLVTNIGRQCYIVDKQGKRLYDFYVNYNPRTEEITDNQLYRASSFSFDTIFNLKFYKLKSNYMPYHRYGAPEAISLENAEKILDFKYVVEIRYQVETINSNGSHLKEYKDETFAVTKKAEFQKAIWATKDKVNAYVMPVLMDLQEGQKYYYIGEGVCEVVEVYDYPKQQSNIICKVAFANSSEKNIIIGDKRFVYIPLNYKSELLQFNTTINELALQPILQMSQEHNLINVMWQPIEDAARYIVKLYRYVNADNRRKVYFLKEYELDRNEHFLSINDIIVNGHIIVVVAENRSGKIVAQSRGIDVATSSGEPKWF